jgi:multiple sugar transport system substrate-binding protein
VAPTTAAAAAPTTAAAAATAPAKVASNRPLTPTFYAWIPDTHPAVKTVSDDFAKTTPLNFQIAPVEGFGIDRFVAEARDKNSTWDVYVGMTPFVEMTALVQADVIEPWDNYIPKDVLNDILPAIKEECSIDGKLYCWPFLLDICVLGTNTALSQKAGAVDLPTTWDEYLINAQKVVDSKAAAYGATFDAHGWRSLAPFTHSLSTKVYTSDNLFDFTSDPAVQALQLMKKMYDLSGPDTLNPGNTDGGVNDTPDENQFSAQKVAYFTKYQNAPIRFSQLWPDPSKLKLGQLPKFANGEGGTVFWDTGMALFKYGQNKDTAAQYLKALTQDERIWQESLSAGLKQTGHVPPYQSIWDKWKANRPSWIQDYPFQVADQLKVSKAIPNHKFGLTQFVIGQQYWQRYIKGETNDPKEALQAAKDAVQAEIKKTG